MTMLRDDVTSALRTALTQVLERPVHDLRPDVRLFDDLHLDSTTMLEMLMAMEDLVGLRVDPEDLDMDDFETVGTFTSFVLASRTAEHASDTAR